MIRVLTSIRGIIMKYKEKNKLKTRIKKRGLNKEEVNQLRELFMILSILKTK